jgi:hypothetical protein
MGMPVEKGNNFADAAKGITSFINIPEVSVLDKYRCIVQKSAKPFMYLVEHVVTLHG